MKLVCDNCQAKYSIGDDRIAGKTFKIRCKKCSHVIVVKGAAVAAPEPAPVDTAGEWHAVIDGEQVGPFERAELLRRHAAGELDNDTFVWREGMADWLAFADVEALATPVTAAPSASDALFSSSPDVFAPPVEPPPETGEAAMRLRNERNESSVLFTLGNLAKLAEPAAPKATAMASPMAAGEGSGLIDIRALASAIAPHAARATASTGSLDDIPTFAPTGFGEPIVLMPQRRAAPDRRLLIALVAMVGLLAILATVLVIVITRSKEAVAQTTEPVPGAVVAVVTEPPAPAPTPTPPPPTPAAEPPAATPAPAPPPATVVPARRTTPNRTTTASTNRTNRTTTTTALIVRPPAKEACSEVTCVVSGYAEKCCEIYKQKTPTPTRTITPPGDLPDGLDRASLAKGIATIKAQACGGRSSAHGDVNVSVKVGPGGNVVGVTVKSSPDPALSACVTAAAGSGSFPKSKRGGTFAYLWRF
ncbi:MAG: GYF domain-containing protein [Kofleriaceae bacterium]